MLVAGVKGVDFVTITLVNVLVNGRGGFHHCQLSLHN